MRRLLALAAFLIVASSVVVATARVGRGGGPLDRPVVFVTSQGLYYDSIVTADPLPAVGPFQLLEMEPMGLQTQYGPGDRLYYGGRWMEDIDGDGEFHYFLCPLLGPGREEP